MKLLFNNDISKNRVFLINIDGVARDYVTPVCEWVNKTFDLKSSPEIITSLNHDFGPIKFSEAVERCFQNEDFVFSLKPYNGFHEFLNTISDILTVIFFTSQKKQQGATRKWVETHLGEYEILFTDNLSELKYCYILDHDPDTVIKSAAQKKISFLVSRNWSNNKNSMKTIENTKFAYSVESFKEVVSFLWSTNLFQSC